MNYALPLAAGLAGLSAGAITTSVLRRLAPTWHPVALAPVLALVWGAAAAFESGAAGYVLGWWCACLVAIDMGSRRLPNAFTYGGAGVTVIYAVVHGSAVQALAGAALLFGCYLVVHLGAPAAFGAGDVKLAFGCGGVAALAGSAAWAGAAVLAPLLTGLIGVLMVALRRPHTRIPHGPAMCLCTLLAVAAVPA